MTWDPLGDCGALACLRTGAAAGGQPTGLVMLPAELSGLGGLLLRTASSRTAQRSILLDMVLLCSFAMQWSGCGRFGFGRVDGSHMVRLVSVCVC